MATPQEFLSKNLKWITLILLLLFLYKSVQSCNRNMKFNITSKQYITQIDSLKDLYTSYYKKTQDSIKRLNFELQLAKEQARLSDEKAKAVQTAVEKIRTNTTTTVVVKGVEEIRDTIKRK